jgi:DNA-binding transcriptional LysR family regulator
MRLAELDVAFELGSNAAIRDAVRRGVGVAFLSYLAVQRELESGELSRAGVEGLHLRRHFYSVYDRRRRLPAAAGAFIHFLEAHPLPVECC